MIDSLADGRVLLDADILDHHARLLREEGRALIAEQDRIRRDLRDRVWPQASAYEALALLVRKREADRG